MNDVFFYIVVKYMALIGTIETKNKANLIFFDFKNDVLPHKK